MCQISQYHIKFLRYSPDNVFAYLGPFLPLYPICGPKSQNFQKIKKLPADTIILHQCTKNHNHSICSSSQSGQAFFKFGPFLHFYPIFGPKYQNFQKMKKRPTDIIILHQCTKNHNHSICSSSDTLWTSFF